MKRFLKKHSERLTAGAIIVYLFVHNIATNQRGYEAIGGEIIFVFLIVALVVYFISKQKEGDDCVE